ncbi:hypothetical protein RHMOL_Rhmol11G0006500 [Rhododendron molle]|uniref:Uncharacterized protein n=1 Tax=Rhododendron molle TaxID=49168 RepID=A0ACC0LMN1_RHOML|nr:hypothetical protein RHMOL_Rhmol11G0006500 [Rhododendron molle]
MVVIQQNLLGWPFEIEPLLWIGLIWYGIKSMFPAGLSFYGWPFWVGYLLKTD